MAIKIVIYLYLKQQFSGAPFHGIYKISMFYQWNIILAQKMRLIVKKIEKTGKTGMTTDAKT